MGSNPTWGTIIYAYRRIYGAVTTFPATVNGRFEAKVVDVVDGDTIDVLIDGAEHRIRYIGTDTPETVHPMRGVSVTGASFTIVPSFSHT